MTNIKDKAVLVQLRISQWTGFKRDLLVTADIMHRYNAT